jgi:hypothetical protein
MSLKPNLQPLGAQQFVALDDVDITSLSAQANKILKVNSLGTSIEAINGADAVGTGVVGDIAVFSGSTPVLGDSGVAITDFFGSKRIKPTLSTTGLRLESDQSNVFIKSGTGFSSVFLDADQTSGNINLTSASQQLIAYNNISLSANGQLTIQAGGGAQILITPTGEISIRSAGAQNLSLQSNGGSSSWVFGGSSFSGGNLLFPTAPPVGECVLKVNSIDNLMYWDPVAPPP